MSNPWASKEPLSNAEFRKLLETPVPRSHRKGEGKKPKQKTERKPDGERVRRRPPRPGAPGDDEKKKKDEKAYRDRARERREGKNPDYEPLLPEMQAILQGKGLGNDIAQLTMEDSKFLGGDLEHTHLVKGLDYALLQKERAKMEEIQANEKVKVRQLKMEDLTFVTPTGSAVYKAIFDRRESYCKDFFAPRRTAFVYGLDQHARSLPTILRRPKSECPQVEESLMASMDANCLQDIAKIMSYLRPAVAGKPHRKLKKKEKLKMLEGIKTKWSDKAAAPGPQVNKSQRSLKVAPPSAIEQDAMEEDDIFGDAGTEYICKSKKKGKEGKEIAGMKRSYFGQEKDDMSDLPPISMDGESGAGPAGEQKIAQLVAAQRKREAEGRDAEGQANDNGEERDPGFLPDHYAECYPGYHQTYATYISDDDEDYSKMDTRGKRLSRYQFDTEEEWQRAQEHQEAMPKAAFQFGVKMSDGRKTHKDLESKRKDQKLETQLNKIQKLMKEKGHDHDNAFKANESMEDATPAVRSRKRLKV
ncbi:hypothetical protein BSKO_03004 [Bryopsis sp. KO-2023]|nr:hypothetical protein BSKO_03004 [Bryopsis sp. KO-2023]